MGLNKKGQAEDFTDWLILIIGLIFLMLFLQLAILKPLSDKTQESTNYFGNEARISNYLVEKRAEVEVGKTINEAALNNSFFLIRSGREEYVS